MKNVIELVECRTAGELLDELHPKRGTWPQDSGAWFYRGHGDSTWQLLPSAFRAGSWRNGFAIPGVVPAVRDDVEFWERLLMKRFYSTLDRAGMQIPRGDELFKLLPTTFGSANPWPDPVLEPLLALAQHRDVPTRLLDWTRYPKVAAYFAAVGALETRDTEQPSQSLDVWAVNQRFIEVWGDRSGDPTCHVVRPLRHGNRNLHAQGGVFTLCRGDVRDDDGNYYPLDVLLTVIARGQRVPEDMLPCLRRFRLPSSEARELLLDLRNDQVDAVTLFPGYSGVVRALREDHWLQPQPSFAAGAKKEPEQPIPGPTGTPRSAAPNVPRASKGPAPRRGKVTRKQAPFRERAPGKAPGKPDGRRRSRPGGPRSG